MDYLVNGVSSMLRDEQSLSSRLGGIISSQTDKLSSWLTRAALGKAIHEHEALEAVYREEAVLFLRSFFEAYKGLREKDLTIYRLALKP